METNKIYQLFSPDEARKHNTESKVWQSLCDIFDKGIGKIWLDKTFVRYMKNGRPVFKEYRLIGIEDNEMYDDYYWIAEDEDNVKKYFLVNYPYFVMKDEQKNC